MAYDEARFFASVRVSIFGGRLRAAQLAGTRTILAGCGKALPQGDRRQLHRSPTCRFLRRAAGGLGGRTRISSRPCRGAD
ncbi:hypothetical protein YA62_002785 [Agrobacterium sp. LC34]|nr:hypothetical protein YA62_002785 [Agrobacterium sp. LC34]